jgi:nitrogen-specific signal transduction histidine kinase
MPAAVGEFLPQIDALLSQARPCQRHPGNLPEIYSDPNTIEQILINLLMSAAHAADKKDSRIIID